MTTTFRTSHRLPHPPAAVRAAVHEPDVLRSAIPGCTDLTATGGAGALRFDATVTAQVARVRGTYRGTGELVDLSEPGEAARLALRLRGRARCGAVDATATCVLTPVGDGTVVDVDVHAEVSGLVGRLGATLLALTGRLMVGEFVSALDRQLASSRELARTA